MGQKKGNKTVNYGQREERKEMTRKEEKRKRKKDGQQRRRLDKEYKFETVVFSSAIIE